MWLKCFSKTHARLCSLYVFIFKAISFFWADDLFSLVNLPAARRSAVTSAANYCAADECRKLHLHHHGFSETNKQPHRLRLYLEKMTHCYVLITQYINITPQMYLSLEINVYKYMLVLMCKINKYNIVYHRAGVRSHWKVASKHSMQMVCKI